MGSDPKHQDLSPEHEATLRNALGVVRAEVLPAKSLDELLGEAEPGPTPIGQRDPGETEARRGWWAGGLAAAAALLVLAVVALPRINSDGDGTLATTNEGESAGPALSCQADFDELQRLLRPNITYDHNPVGDVSELIDDSDAVVIGRLVSFQRTRGELRNETDYWTTLSIDVEEVLHSPGDPQRDFSRFSFQSFWAGGQGPDPIEMPVAVDGARILAFLSEWEAPGGFTGSIQGMAFDCAGNTGPEVAEPVILDLPPDINSLPLEGIATAVRGELRQRRQSEFLAISSDDLTHTADGTDLSADPGPSRNPDACGPNERTVSGGYSFGSPSDMGAEELEAEQRRIPTPLAAVLAEIAAETEMSVRDVLDHRWAAARGSQDATMSLSRKNALLDAVEDGPDWVRVLLIDPETEVANAAFVVSNLEGKLWALSSSSACEWTFHERVDRPAPTGAADDG